jgi:uncharacterized protein
LYERRFERAAEFAKSIAVQMLTVEADELGDPNFTANKADRCFHCKSHLCKTLLDIAAERGFDHVAFGTNYDDLDDYRPGNRAMKVFGIRSPLAEAKLTMLSFEDRLWPGGDRAAVKAD